MVPVVDIHCDLLSYLSKAAKRTPNDLKSRCSIPQLRKGHVKVQVMAIFTRTVDASVMDAEKQIECMQALHNSPYISPFLETEDLSTENTLYILPAFENASSFCTEQEPLAIGLERLTGFVKKVGQPAYMSLTWNGENRFGGGNETRVGLKPDGKTLLEWMNSRQIALDFSHTSDELADDIFNEIEARGYTMPVLASHSNFRAVVDSPRNLSDKIAKEIIRRKGIIGLNFLQKFLGSGVHILKEHIIHGLSLGGEDAICFGADFFCTEDLKTLGIPSLSKYPVGMENSACYPFVINFLQENGMCIEKLAYKNALDVLKLR